MCTHRSTITNTTPPYPATSQAHIMPAQPTAPGRPEHQDTLAWQLLHTEVSLGQVMDVVQQHLETGMQPGGLDPILLQQLLDTAAELAAERKLLRTIEAAWADAGHPTTSTFDVHLGNAQVRIYLPTAIVSLQHRTTEMLRDTQMLLEACQHTTGNR